MDKETMEQALDKPLEQSLQDGMETVAKAESDWFLLPLETRDHILIEVTDSAEFASTLPITQALLAMFRVGYYYGKKGG